MNNNIECYWKKEEEKLGQFVHNINKYITIYRSDNHLIAT